MKLKHRDLVPNGPGSIKIIPEEDDDMWHAYNLISAGDMVQAFTVRGTCCLPRTPDCYPPPLISCSVYPLRPAQSTRCGLRSLAPSCGLQRPVFLHPLPLHHNGSTLLLGLLIASSLPVPWGPLLPAVLIQPAASSSSSLRALPVCCWVSSLTFLSPLFFPCPDRVLLARGLLVYPAADCSYRCGLLSRGLFKICCVFPSCELLQSAAASLITRTVPDRCSLSQIADCSSPPLQPLFSRAAQVPLQVPFLRTAPVRRSLSPLAPCGLPFLAELTPALADCPLDSLRTDPPCLLP
ncbi:hypothetical protein KSP39_PZI021674 [Platanthera zijinensis]|uniref:Pelota N-terminal domain-containing protein n=1 Tax=Platanthera zijinensis TaxID=2320716 RepID=A0AAP0FWG1_9ASPA